MYTRESLIHGKILKVKIMQLGIYTVFYQVWRAYEYSLHSQLDCRIKFLSSTLNYLPSLMRTQYFTPMFNAKKCALYPIISFLCFDFRSITLDGSATATFPRFVTRCRTSTSPSSSDRLCSSQSFRLVHFLAT